MDVGGLTEQGKTCISRVSRYNLPTVRIRKNVFVPVKILHHVLSVVPVCHAAYIHAIYEANKLTGFVGVLLECLLRGTHEATPIPIHWQPLILTLYPIHCTPDRHVSQISASSDLYEHVYPYLAGPRRGNLSNRAAADSSRSGWMRGPSGVPAVASQETWTRPNET